MKYPIDYQNIPVQVEFYKEVVSAYQEATGYLLSFNWCSTILNAALYLNLGATLCIFLFEIENSSSSDDNYLWVLVGDIPPMYLDIYGPKTTKEVLENYVYLAEDWVEHVKLGKSVKDCYPFKTEPTLEMAIALERRTSFMKSTLFDNIDDIPLH